TNARKVSAVRICIHDQIFASSPVSLSLGMQKFRALSQSFLFAEALVVAKRHMRPGMNLHARRTGIAGHRHVTTRLCTNYLVYLGVARTLRPRARRRLITRRPPTVFMRARKPWVRRRLMVLGWYVLLLMTDSLHYCVTFYR